MSPCPKPWAQAVNGLLAALLALAVPARGADSPDAKPAPAATGLVYSEQFLQHDTGAGHPERPARLTAIMNRLREEKLLPQLVPLPPQPATLEWIRLVHASDYIARVEHSCRSGQGFVDTPDAPASTNSYDLARLATGGVLGAVDAVMAGRVRNAFCAVRPPGHHALTNRAMGFCLFNNVAIAARYLQRRHGVKRVLIVDWDVHHGNGTQAAFYADPTVFYFSTHQSPFYPGTGSAEETGEGAGRGQTLNVPLPADSGDAAYEQAFVTRLLPAAAAFRPEFVLVSAGFDAAEHDLLGRMKLTPAGYANLTRHVKRIAATHAGGRLVSVLEGGYDLDALAASAAAHVRTLME